MYGADKFIVQISMVKLAKCRIQAFDALGEDSNLLLVYGKSHLKLL